MSKTAQTVTLLRIIATVAGLSLLMWSISFPTIVKSAEAASITSASDTLSDSDKGVVANHTIQFSVPHGAISGEQITISFPTGVNEFVLPTAGFDYGDLDVTVGGAPITLGNTPAGTTWGVSTTSSTIVLTTSTTSGATIASSTAVVVKIGTNATVGTTGDSQIVNPTAGASYEITVSGTIQDSGAFRVVILDDVDVTASVDTNFTFAVAGVDAALTVNGTTTNATSTSTAVPFGTLSAGVIKTFAQDLTVSTNARNGFAVTVYESTPLESSTGADIDGFKNGEDTSVPAAWVAPSANPIDDNTWGHWGMTSNDPDLFTSNMWIAPSTTPRTVFSHNSVVIASTTRVGYQAQITAMQEAGDDYTTSLTYIATPTF